MGVGVHKVLRIMGIKAGKSSIPAICFVERVGQYIFQAKIHHTCESRIETIFVVVSRLKISNFGGRFHPTFAHHIHAGIFVADRLYKVGRHANVVVRVSIHAHPVDIGIFYPIHIDLTQIIVNKVVFKVKVGHIGRKPTICKSVQIGFGSVRIGPGCHAIIGRCISRPYIEPVFCR